MRFKDPAHSGLFTLVEVTEEEDEAEDRVPSVCSTPAPSEIDRTPSAVPSSACFPSPSPRVETSSPVGVHDAADDEMEEIPLDDADVEDKNIDSECNVKKWRLNLPPRPNLLTAITLQELAPPFEVEDMVPASPKLSRRPSPLKLTTKRRPLSWYNHHPFAARPFRESRPASEPALLSPAPIASPGVYRARQRSGSAPSPTDKTFDSESLEIRALQSSPVSDGPSRSSSADEEVNLELVLEDLLAQCGEISPRFQKYYSVDWVKWIEQGPRDQPGSSGESSDSDLDCDFSSFPFPPARQLLSPLPLSPALFTPSSPPPVQNPFDWLASPATPATRAHRDDDWVPALKGDHSFLQAMSRGEDVPSVSSGSSLSMPLSPGSSLRSSTSSSRSSKLPARKCLPDMWRV